MGHKKMFNGPQVNQRCSDKQNFGFATNGGQDSVTTSVGNSSRILSVRAPYKHIVNAFIHVIYPSMQDSWYKDVIELRKKAGEYKVGIVDNLQVF